MAVPRWSFPRSSLPLAVVLCAVALLCACSNRASVAARATVETFYTAIQADNLPVVQDNIAASASPQFQQHVLQAATAAQDGGVALKAVQVVKIDAPSINGSTARVTVVFADGGADTVVLAREGERWKVVSSGRLG
jgi:hypothetical protein